VVVAAPQQKLCPAKLLAGSLAAVRAALTSFANFGFENGDPTSHWNRGPAYNKLEIILM